MKTKTLILGARGQLGRALASEFGGTGEVIETVHRNPSAGQQTADLSDAGGLITLMDRIRPGLILIAGAFCNVDLCETEARACRRVNAEGPGVIAEWARNHGGTVVYYSTDHVFDGSLPEYSESDAVRPLSVYAASKAEGEAAVRNALPDAHLILRTSGLYGPDAARKNFVIRLVDRLRAGETVRLPSDQWGSPTATQDLASATRFLLEKDLRGTYHATGPDFLPRTGLAHRICAFFKLDERLIVPTPTQELQQPAKRPLRVKLNTGKLKSAGAPAFRSIEQGLTVLGIS